VSEEAFFDQFARNRLAKRSSNVGFGELLGDRFSTRLDKARRPELAQYTFEYLIDVLR
jgi:hypothetical protein